ncbi:MAG: hypothetical protein C0397_10420 [Odoribacter sp.]|nr:hypothetical protein [Odoribacter sp.]
MLEGGINLLGDWDYDSKPFTEGFGISLGTSDYFTRYYLTGEEKFWDSYKTMNYSLAPRLGYFLFRNFVVGLDFRYRRNTLTYSSNSKDSYRTELYGVFARKYFGNNKVTPFIEGGIGFGLSQMSTSETSPGGAHYKRIERRDQFYLCGATGASYSIISKFKINLLVKFQHTREKPINTSNYSTSHTKTLNFDSALILSFSYFFNQKIKE